MRKLLFGVTALAVAVALVASASARPGKHEKSISGGAAPSSGGQQDLTRPAGMQESTSFEAAHGFIANTEICGGPANGFCTIAPPFANQCPAAGTNCCSTDPHPQSNWFRSGTDQHCSEPHIDTINPSHLSQHLRFVFAADCTGGVNDGLRCTSGADCPGGTCDANGGNPLGCAGFTVTCRQTAFTPLQVAPTATTTVDYDIAGGPVGGSQTRFFCADDSAPGTPNIFMGFYFTGQIVVYDYTNLAYVYHPWDTTGAYGHVNILYDRCAGDVIEYRYNGTLFHSGPMAAAGFSPAVDRCIFDNDNGIGTWDVDNYVVNRVACPSICDGVLVEPGEFCDGDAPGGGCPPGRCNATCTGCTPICTAAAPCELVNGQNGPYITPCDPQFGCIFHYIADTEVVSMDTCGSSFDTQILYWGSTADPGDPGSGNDDCCLNGSPQCGPFGAGSDSSASCYTDPGFDLDSCTCHDNPMAGDNDWSAQITASGPSLPPSGATLMVFIDKKLACNQEWLNGACCDHNSQVSGPAGCTDDVPETACSAPDQTWTFNKFCASLTCDCIPDCTNFQCGSDGCGGSCGTCDDQLACTADTCDANKQCVYTPRNCDDGCGCTVDTCVEPAGTCLNTPSNAACDDGLFCNGSETCSVAACCSGGTPPCLSTEICNEVTDTCDPGVIPTVSVWGLLVMSLLLLAGAKVYFGRRNAIA